MADKTSTSTQGFEVSQTYVTTAGTIAADTVSIIFDDASTSGSILALLEKAKLQIVAYYAKR